MSIKGMTSMATRRLLVELADAHGGDVAIEAAGGVDVVRRIEAGEAFDFVVLASDVIDKLAAQGRVGSRVDLVRSQIAVAVASGRSHPDISSERSVKDAVVAARRVGLSTGPSGKHLRGVFEHWGGNIVEAPPG